MNRGMSGRPLSEDVIGAMYEYHERRDNGTCVKCGIEDCDVMVLLAEVERLRAAVQAVRDTFNPEARVSSGVPLTLAEQVQAVLDAALGGER